jgi:hypothetical protein
MSCVHSNALGDVRVCENLRIVAFLIIGKKQNANCMFHVPWHDMEMDRDRDRDRECKCDLQCYIIG